jgi:hypothetical protein
VFAGKRIAIIGPASSAFNTGNGQTIENYDIVIRVNKSAHIVATKKFTRDIGDRTDVLFHSFFENNESGGGPLNLKVFDEQGVQYLINPRNTWGGQRNTFNFYKKYRVARTVYTLPARVYRDICKPLNGYRPTIGFTALMTALTSEFKELYISGFSFYRTPFGAGYRDQIESAEKALAFIREQGIHNIDLEFESFKNVVATSAKNIVMDDVLIKLVKQELK